MGLAFPRAASLLSIVERETGLDIRRAIERGGRALGQTDVLQPSLVAVAWACAEAMQQAGLRADRCLGHSLGALSAAAWEAGLSAESAVGLAATRGRAMRSCASEAGAMLAVRAPAEEVEAALTAGVCLAADNAPDEAVVSGDAAALRRFASEIPWPSRPLRVSGAWHSPAMAPAVAPLRAAALSAFDDARVADALAEDLVRPVRFAPALGQLADDGYTDLIFVAPGRVPFGLARRTLGARLALHRVESPADVAATVSRMGRAVDADGRDP